MDSAEELPPDPDERSLARIHRGDAAAFEDMVEKYKRPMIVVITRMLHDQTEAEDVVQNVFLRVFASAVRFRRAARFSTWLYTITRNLGLNELRRRSRHPAVSLDEPPAGWNLPSPRRDESNAGPLDALLLKELWQQIEEALAALPLNQRRAIVLL